MLQKAIDEDPGFEITDKLALRTKEITKVGIDYEPRAYNQGKKILVFDGLGSLFVILWDRIFG